jgi:methionyl-tRNA formyltransferase
LLERRIRAFNPAPGAWFAAKGERVRVLRAVVEPAPAGKAPGTVLDAEFRVACGGGALRLLELQRAGKAPMETSAFLRGFPLPPEVRLD